MQDKTLFSPKQIDTVIVNLQEQIRDIYDAYQICRLVGEAIADWLNTATLVCYRARYEERFVVWHCDPTKSCKQMRWSAESSLADYLKNLTAPPTFITQAELADGLHNDSNLLDIIQETAVIAPFEQNEYTMHLPGAICLIDPAPHLQEQADALQRITSAVFPFLERALLYLRYTQQEIVSDVVNDISVSLTSTLSLEDILDKVSNPVRRTLDVESVSIGLIEQGTRDIIFIQELFGPLFEDIPPLRLKAGQGIAGWVSKHNEPILVNDVYSDERFFSEMDEVSGFQTKSMICVPLMIKHELIGVLEAINKRAGQFDQSDVSLMQAIANPLAIALENAILHTEVVAEKRRVEAIFDNMSEGMLTVDPHGKITNLNDSLLSLLQDSDTALLDQKVHTAIRAANHELGDFFDRILTGNSDENHSQLACEVFSSPTHETVPVLISGAAIKDEQNKISEAIFVFSDLRQIREVERMRDDIFHNIVHDFRTPLATVLMYARLMRQNQHGENDLSRAEYYTDVIERESDRLQAMIRKMLEVAKLEAREMQRRLVPVDMNELFEELITPATQQAVEKGLTFSADIAEDLPQIMGDRETLYSIFKNLIENAFKFTPKGSVKFNAYVDKHIMYVEVADEGIGVAKHAIPNLFKRFYRTQTAVEHGIAGTGLGLNMVSEGVEYHKGSVSVKSELGKGTTFFIELPIKT